eukprot:scaffold587412_cov46-Prasinocladus_malaysianus.AAC.2
MMLGPISTRTLRQQQCHQVAGQTRPTAPQASLHPPVSSVFLRVHLLTQTGNKPVSLRIVSSESLVTAASSVRRGLHAVASRCLENVPVLPGSDDGRLLRTSKQVAKPAPWGCGPGLH